MRRALCPVLLVLAACQPPSGEEPQPKTPKFTAEITGNLVIDSQATLTEANAVVKSVSGDVILNATDVTVFKMPLLQRVGGTLKIEKQPVSSVEGFTALESLGGLSIKDDGALTTLALDAMRVTKTGAVEVSGLPKLTSISLLTGATEAASVRLSGLSFAAGGVLDAIVTVKGDFTLDAVADEELVAFSALETVAGKLTITRCAKLTKLAGFAALTSVRSLVISENPKLETIDIDSSLVAADSLIITKNTALLPRAIRPLLRVIDADDLQLSANVEPVTSALPQYFNDLVDTPVPAAANVQLTLSFDAQKDAVTISPIAETADAQISIDSIVAPGNKQLGDGGYTFSETNRVYASPGAFGFLLPQSPSNVAKLPAGEYRIGLSTFGSKLTVHVAKKKKPAKDARLWIDVNLFLSGAATVTAATAAKSPRLQKAIDDLSRLYASAGIEVREVRYFDIPAKYQSIDSEAQLTTLFQESKAAPAGLNFFFIEEQTFAEPSLLGQSAGIPGPAPMQGTGSSGVIVVYDRNDSKSGDVLGIVMAHEGAHFLGLFHLIEFNGSLDNLADTPGDGNELQKNIMFPAATQSMKLFSAEQMQVLRGNALVFE